MSKNNISSTSGCWRNRTMAGVDKTKDWMYSGVPWQSDQLVSGGREMCAPQRPRAKRGLHASLQSPPLVHVRWLVPRHLFTRSNLSVGKNTCNLWSQQWNNQEWTPQSQAKLELEARSVAVGFQFQMSMSWVRYRGWHKHPHYWIGD